MNTAIRVENLGKEYHLGTRERGYTTLRETVMKSLVAPWQRFRTLSGATAQDARFWALRDVSFEVGEGEVVGIIGRNGAGKSTLLKLLSQITDPSEGCIEMHGRVGSLLEVGTGFHPELTGRENIFLNGAILGMKRSEIARKFDEIVDFSGVEAFLDTPVKRYSSGMYTRLAFSVAAHLELEIMIVDEVLAVGDAAFQDKCLGKMNQVARSGRTVLFVSHNMAAVETLCSRGIVLEAGKVAFDGSQAEAVRHYFRSSQQADNLGEYRCATERMGSGGKCRIVSARVSSPAETSKGMFPCGAPLQFEVECTGDENSLLPAIGIGVNNGKGVRIVSFHTKCDPAFSTGRKVAGTTRVVCQVPGIGLVPGQYSVTLGLDSGGELVEHFNNAFQFVIQPSDFFGNLGKRVGGVICCKHQWQLEDCAPAEAPEGIAQ